jgi:hypothetical protein
MMGQPNAAGMILTLYPLVFDPFDEQDFWNFARAIKASLRLSESKDGAANTEHCALLPSLFFVRGIVAFGSQGSRRLGVLFPAHLDLCRNEVVGLAGCVNDNVVANLDVL